MLTPSTGIPALTDTVARNHAERLHLVTQATNDVVWDWDLVTNEVQFSQSVDSLFLFSPDEKADTPEWWITHIHPDDRARVVEDIYGAINGGGQFWAAEYRFLRGDGSVSHVFDRGFISRDEKGKAVRMVGSMFDITDRKIAEAALRDSERRFRSLIENASDAISIVGPDGTFIFASDGYRTVLGYDPSELKGSQALDIVHEADLAAAKASLARISNEPGGTIQVKLRCRHKDGSWRLMESRARNLMHDPSIGGIVSASRDITEQQALEAELVQAQKMEAIGQLAGGVAHDFNNLLTVISTNLELMATSLPPQSPTQENLAEIRRAATHAAGLTRQLLNFTQRRSEDPQVVNLNEVVRDSEGLLRRVVGEQSELRVNTSTKPPLLKMDRAQLEQVLMNLVFNARDALPAAGVVEVATERATVAPGDTRAPASLAPGEYSVLVVRDTGSGMTPETRARAFDPFYTTKETGKGTGLGLAMVYTIVKHAGGAINLETKPGAGTTFRIYLPRVAASFTTPFDGTPAVRPTTGTETILLVEDEDMVRKVVRRTLVAQGYNVIEAVNGSDALSLALQDPARISLVLTDVMMPQMGGPELARRLWERSPGLKIMFLSGYAPDTMSPESAVPTGAILIEKPFAIEKLMMKVREVLDSDSAGTLRMIDTPAQTN